MIPFSRFRYPDDIRIQRVRWEEVQGTPVARYDTPLEPVEKASVQSKSVQRTDPQGRITTVTIHTVRTATNRNLHTQDHVVWTDKSGAVRPLTVEAGSVPKGIGDVQYMTECVETV